MAITFFELQLKGGILLAISVLVYILFFSGDSFFNRNRAYLLSSLFIPWFIPLIAMPVWMKNLFFGTPDIVNNLVIPMAIANTDQLPVTISVESTFSWELFGLYLYGIISFVLLIRLLWAYSYIIRLKYESELTSFNGFRMMIIADKKASPFSFFRTIYLPKELEKSIDKNLVLGLKLACLFSIFDVKLNTRKGISTTLARRGCLADKTV